MLLLTLTVALAADRFVETAGTDAGNDCLVASSPCGTIHSALAMAAPGDTVHVGAGSFASTAVAYPLDIPPGVDLIGMGEGVTSLFASVGPVLSVGGGEHSRISGLSVASDGGAAVMGEGPLHATLDHITMGPGTGSGLAYSSSAASGDLTLTLEEITAIDLGGPAVDVVEAYGVSNLAQSIHVDGLVVDALTDSVSISLTGNHDTEVVLDNLTITHGAGASVDTAVSVRIDRGFDARVLMRNASITGSAAVGASFVAGSTGSFKSLVLEDVTIHNADTGLLVDLRASGSGSTVWMSRLQFAECSDTALSVDSRSINPLELDLRDTSVDASSGSGAGVVLGASRYTNARIEGLSFEGSGVDSAVVWDTTGLGSSTTWQPSLSVRSSELSNAHTGLELSLGNLSRQTVDVVGNRVVGNSVGVLLGGDNDALELPPRMRHNRFDGNGYALEVGFRDVTVDAGSNWFGTTSTSTVEANILDADDDVSRGDVVFTALSEEPPTFQVAGHHTRRRSEMLVVADGGSTPFVSSLGGSSMSAYVDGSPVRVQHVEDDGIHMRIERPRLAAGAHTLEVVDPNGLSSTGSFTVEPAPDSIVMEHQDWLRATGNWTRISNAPPNALFRVYTSADIFGPPACPSLMGGRCLQITEPYVEHQGNTQRTNSQGVAWIRIEPPAASSAYYEDTELQRLTSSSGPTFIDLAAVGFDAADIDAGRVWFRAGVVHEHQSWTGVAGAGVGSSALEVKMLDVHGQEIPSPETTGVAPDWDSGELVQMYLDVPLEPGTRVLETTLRINPLVFSRWEIFERYRGVYMPNGVVHPDYVSTQVVVKDPNSDRIYLSPPTTMHFQTRDGDSDRDGVSNFDEHRDNTRVYVADTDGDGCSDGEDAHPHVASFDLDGSGYPDDCER